MASIFAAGRKTLIEAQVLESYFMPLRKQVIYSARCVLASSVTILPGPSAGTLR